jgi:hypothetical protein
MGPRTCNPCASNAHNPARIPADHGGCNQALDAVMYQASFSGYMKMQNNQL